MTSPWINGEWRVKRRVYKATEMNWNELNWTELNWSNVRAIQFIYVLVSFRLRRRGHDPWTHLPCEPVLTAASSAKEVRGRMQMQFYDKLRIAEGGDVRAQNLNLTQKFPQNGLLSAPNFVFVDISDNTIFRNAKI